MPLEVVVATRNRGKVGEFARLLGDAFALVPLREDVGLPEETGADFAENARLKAWTVFEGLGGRVAVLADDSGLEVAALGGRPGVRSARFAGPDATDAANVAKLLEELRGVRGVEARRARFVCALALLAPSTGGGVGAEHSGTPAGTGAPTGRLVEAAGEFAGAIAVEPAGTEGFGYDPVFVPRGWDQTLAQVGPDVKNRVSHRAAAVAALLGRLREGQVG